MALTTKTREYDMAAMLDFMIINAAFIVHCDWLQATFASIFLEPSKNVLK